MKNRTLTVLTLLILTLSLLLSSCQGAAEPIETGKTKGVATTPGIVQTTGATKTPATTPGIVQTTEATKTPAATTEKTVEKTKPAWTEKHPAVNEKDFVLSPVKLEKIDQSWTDAMIIDSCAVQIILQPYASGKEYTEEDFADVGCTEIVIYQLRVYEGYHCRKITFFFENPTKSPNYATQVYEKLEEREDVYVVDNTSLYRPLD